ncbi:MAG TPA: hypothetical protein VMV16_00035 [Solirubrobacteraceae bacterium]|nr:hypothetical protein [Solirubrobacteraceae bacterium]
MSNEPEQPVTTEDPTAVTDAGRMRRPSSLRSAAGAAVAAGVASESASASDADSASGGDSAFVSGADGASGTGLRSKLTAASFPRGKLTAASFPRRGPRTVVEPVSTTDPAAPVPDAGPSPSQKLVTLVSERPEVGLGIAFAAGLVIATILKRLAR